MGEEAAELERLSAERDELKNQVERMSGERKHRFRKVLAAILAILTVICFVAVVPGAWSRRIFFNTDRWIATTSPLASDPAVQEYVARTVTDEIFAALDVQAKVSAALTQQNPALGFLAGPITDGARGFVYDQVLKVVESDRFQELWVQAQTKLHDNVITALKGGSTDVLSLANGQVSLNLLPILNAGLQQMTSTAQDLLGSGVTVPDVTINQVPSEVIARLESVLNVDLPDDFGSVVVYKSTQFAELQTGVYWFNRLVVALIVGFFILFIGTLAVSVRRRRSLLQMSAAMSIGLVVERRISLAGREELLGQVKPENQAAARSVSDSLMHSLLRYTGWLLAIWLVIIVVALVTGPYPWAVAMRARLGRMASTVAAVIASAFTPNPDVADMIRPRRDLLMVVGAAIGLLLFLFFDLSMWGSVIVGGVLLGYEIVVFRAGKESEVST